MDSLNQVILIGNLTRDPETKMVGFIGVGYLKTVTSLPWRGNHVHL